MGSGARNDLNLPRFLKVFQAADQIFFVPVHKRVMHLEKQPVVHESQGLKIGERSGPGNFLLGKLYGPLQFFQVTRLEKRIEKHRSERGCKRECQAEINAVFDQAINNQKQRDIGLGNGLEEPVLL